MAATEDVEVAGPRETRDAGSLARAMPRALIAEGLSEGLARDWIDRANRERSAGGRAIARYAFVQVIADALFDARRARRVVRGLEGAEHALKAEAMGLERVEAARLAPGARRLSRLLVISSDGSERFLRQVERLRSRHFERLEVLMLDCDDEALGGAIYGGGRRARAVLIDHKEAVARLLSVIARIPSEGEPVSNPSS